MFNSRENYLVIILSIVLGLVLVLLPELSLGQTKLVKVAVVDSGFNMKYKDQVKLCKSGHYDFTTNKAEIGHDSIGHGTEVSLVIGSINKESNYCLVIYKVFSKATKDVGVDYNKVYKTALKERIRIMNLAFSGGAKIKDEEMWLNKLSLTGTIILAAMGNENRDLSIQCDTYPACYNVQGLVMVEGVDYYKEYLDADGKHIPVLSSYMGTGLAARNKLVVRNRLCSNFHQKRCGSSMATAWTTADLLRHLSLERN